MRDPSITFADDVFKHVRPAVGISHQLMDDVSLVVNMYFSYNYYLFLLFQF